MPKEEWGVKRVCPNCQSRFYDLQNDPMTCPECGHSFTAESLASGKARTMVADKADPKSAAAAAATEEEEDAVVLDDDDDDDVVEESDDDVLDDDDDDDVPLDEIADVASEDSEDDS